MRAASRQPPHPHLLGGAATAPAPAGAPGRSEVPLEAKELPLLVERLAGRRPVHRLLAAVARQPRLFERVLPGAVQLLDARAMCETSAREGHHLRLLVAPASESVGPLASAAWLERLFAARDHAAIDDAGHERRHLAGCHSDHRLVE